VPVRPLAIAHQGQFPAVTISFNLAGRGAGDKPTEAVQHAVIDMGMPGPLRHSFQGTRSVSAIARHGAVADPGGARRVYLILGVLYESYIHPLTISLTASSAGVGRDLRF